MKNQFYKIIIKRCMSAIITLLLLLSFSGCWGQNEINDIVVINTIGLDAAEDGGIKLTVLVSAPIGGVAGMGQTDKANVWYGTATGSSIVDAMYDLNRIATNRIVLFHNKYVIISAELAKKGLKEITDFFIRDSNTRYSARVLISEGEASEMLKVPADIEKNLPEEIDGIINNAIEWSESYIPDMLEFKATQSEDGICSIVGKIGYVMSSDNTYSTNRESLRQQYWLDREFGIAVIEGCSIVKKHKFVGFLDREETRGTLWIMGRVNDGSITVLTGGEDKIAFRIIPSSASLSPQLIDNEFVMNVKLTTNVKIETLNTNFKVTKENDIKEMQKLCEEHIKMEMKKSLEKLQKEYVSDVYGFGRAIKIKYAKEFKNIENDWENVYRNMKVNFDVKVTIERFGESY